MVERLIADHGAFCHYCPRPVRLRITFQIHRTDDATIDHKVPRAKGGTNAYDNLLLSCWSCNNAKGDQDYAEFKRDPRPAHIKERERLRAARAAQLKRASQNPLWRHPVRLGNGTMASAIERGDMDETGKPIKPKIAVPTWMDWPWLCELMVPLIRDVGSLGPWGNSRPSPAPPGVKMVLRGGYWMEK